MLKNIFFSPTYTWVSACLSGVQKKAVVPGLWLRIANCPKCLWGCPYLWQKRKVNSKVVIAVQPEQDSKEKALQRQSRQQIFSILEWMLCISPIFTHSQKYIHGLYTCVPSCLSSVWTKSWSFQYINKYYICFTSNSVLIPIHPFSKNLRSPTLLPSYLLQQKAATSLNKHLFVHLCLHFVYKHFLCPLFFLSSKSFIADVVWAYCCLIRNWAQNFRGFLQWCLIFVHLENTPSPNWKFIQEIEKKKRERKIRCHQINERE